MFDPYDSPLLLPPSGGNYEPEAAPEPDRIDYALEGISRFTGLFALGITVTLIARWPTALLPFYWMGAIACILALALPAYLSRSALEALVDGCDLLIIPTTPDILSIDATLETVDLLESLKCDRYRILLTIVPAGRKTGEQTRDALAELPLFKQSIRQYAAYEKAALAGLLVYEVKDRNARIAWSDYQRLGKEILQ